MSTDFWTTRRNSPRVQAALTRECQLCKAPAGQDCGQVTDNSKPLATGLIHQIRVKEADLFKEEA